jgi:hypothetical protein
MLRARERLAFIHARRGRCGVKLLCRVLITDHSNCHVWVRARVRRLEREVSDRGMAEWIMEGHAAHPEFGVPRVARELQRQGSPVGRRVGGPADGRAPAVPGPSALLAWLPDFDRGAQHLAAANVTEA